MMRPHRAEKTAETISKLTGYSFIYLSEFSDAFTKTYISLYRNQT